MIDDLFNQLSYHDEVTVHIVASASRVPTRGSNQSLAEKRGDEAIRRVELALTARNIDLKRVKFVEQTFVQGPRYENDARNKDRYEPFQYIKIWLVTCVK